MSHQAQQSAIKICGLSRPEEIDAAIESGADFVGLVFYPPSPRNVTLAHGEALANHARSRIKIVALVVDADDQLLDDISTKIKPDYFQAHGSETPQRIKAIKTRTQIPIIKAIKVRDRRDVDLADVYADIADIILFDAKAPPEKGQGLPGGNGVAFDWSLLEHKDVPDGFMLSGGLDPENVARAIRQTRPGIVDVSSGVEIAPGRKDIAAIKKFIEASRSAG